MRGNHVSSDMMKKIRKEMKGCKEACQKYQVCLESTHNFNIRLAEC